VVVVWQDKPREEVNKKLPLNRHVGHPESYRLVGLFPPGK
jgi:hypothetical protein